MGNILKACLAIANNPQIDLMDFYSGRNRINNVGKALEVFIADAFAGSINETDELKRLRKLEENFSYSGNQNNPPDLILHGSDAIEVKKTQSPNATLALNSSYPKAKVYANSTMITQACRDCEEWEVKDIIYAIGHTSDNSLNSLWFVYGDCYAADKETYERIKNTITTGLCDISDVEFTETNELGKVKRVDPLGITDLRIRGMWSILNPRRVFDYIHEPSLNSIFELVTIMRTEKYNLFPEECRNQVETSELLEIKDIKFKNPNNPVNLIDGKLITFKLEDI